MLLTGFITSSYTLNSCIDNYFKETNLADIWITTDRVTKEDEQFFVDENIDFNKRLYFESVAEIKTLQISNSVRVFVYKNKIDEPYSRICEPYIESGKVYTGHGCLIDKNVAQDHNIKAGFDNINFSYTINLGGEDITLDFEEQLTGTMSLDECADTYSSWSVVIEEEMFFSHIKQKLAEKVEGFDESMLLELPYNQILVKTDDVSKTTDLIKSHYAREEVTSNLLYLFGRDSVESVQLLNEEIAQSKKITYVFPVIFLIVAVLVILTTIDQLVIQERKRIGILKSCGVPNKKILRHYSRYGAILCLIGAVAGTFFGLLLIPEVMFSKYANIYSIPSDYINLTIPVWWLLLMIVGVVALGYLVSFLSCYKILNKNPIECLRFDLSASAKKLKKRKKQYKKVPISVRMAVRNIKIKPLRTTMATIGIAGCVALLVAGFGVGNTLSKSLKNDYGKMFYYDVTSTYKTENFKDKLLTDSRVELVEDYSRVYVEAIFQDNQENVYVYQIVENSSLTDIKLSQNEVKISSSTAKDLGVKTGDVIEVKVHNKSVKLTISGVVNTSSLNGIYVCDDLGFAEGFVTRGVWVKTNHSAEIVDFANTINGTNTAQTIETQKKEVESRIMSTLTMTNTIRVFAVLLAIIVLLNLIFLILKERSIEIATLKVVGLNSWQVSISVFLEVIFMACVGAVIGMMLGYPLMLLILAVNRVAILNYMPTISAMSFVLSVLIIAVTILAVLLVCYLKIRRVNMAESLKSGE